MKIQWQQGAVFDGAYTHDADVGGGVTLHVWRREPGVWCWYAERGGQEFPAYHSERSVAAAKAAAAAWWKAHGRVRTTRRVVWGDKQTFLAGTGADPEPKPLVEQPVEQLQQDGPGFSLTDPIGGPDAGAQIPVEKPGVFGEFDRSPVALEVMRQATRAGVTKESIGEWMNLAARWERLGKHADAAACARKAIEIHETWGRLHATYAMSEGTLERARAIAAQAEG
jgi:hypothetical protein